MADTCTIKGAWNTFSHFGGARPLGLGKYFETINGSCNFNVTTSNRMHCNHQFVKGCCFSQQLSCTAHTLPQFLGSLNSYNSNALMPVGVVHSRVSVCIHHVCMRFEGNRISLWMFIYTKLPKSIWFSWGVQCAADLVFNWKLSRFAWMELSALQMWFSSG